VISAVIVSLICGCVSGVVNFVFYKSEISGAVRFVLRRG